MSFTEHRANSYTPRNGGRSGPRKVSLAVSIVAYEPKSGDLTNWRAASVDDVMVVRLLHDVPSAKLTPADPTTGDPTLLRVKAKNHDDERKNTVRDLAFGKGNYDAMTPVNEPVLAIDGVINADGTVTAEYMNRTHYAYDHNGARILAGSWTTVHAETDSKRADANGKFKKKQDMVVQFVENALPLSMCGIQPSAMQEFFVKKGLFLEPKEGVKNPTPDDMVAGDLVARIVRNATDFASGDLERTRAAVWDSAFNLFDYMERSEAAGRHSVTFRGVGMDGKGFAVSMFRNWDSEAGALEPIEAALTRSFETQKVANFIAFAVKEPNAYWDIWPTISVGKGGMNKPSEKMAKDLKDARDRLAKGLPLGLEDNFSDFTNSDERQFATIGQPNNEGNQYNTQGYARSVTGLGRILETNVLTGQKEFTGPWFAMKTSKVEFFEPNRTIETLPTVFMPPELTATLEKAAKENQERYWKEFKEPLELKRATWFRKDAGLPELPKKDAKKDAKADGPDAEQKADGPAQDEVSPPPTQQRQAAPGYRM